MQRSTKLAFIASLFVLIGFPVIFLIISLITGEWRFLSVSFPGSFIAGLTGLMVTKQQIKKERKDL